MPLKKDTKELLAKFCNNNINADEFKELKSGINEIPESELKCFLESEWEEYGNYHALPPQKVEELYDKLNLHGTSTHAIFHYGRKWLQIAASILLLIASSLFVITYIQRSEIKDMSEKTVVINSGEYGNPTVTLPDGTLVHLNSSSSLTYSQDFGRENRIVQLSGEGFFEVKKNTEKTFTVKTGYIDINVSGTKFNVYSYKDQDIVEMSLVEGSVNINTETEPHISINVSPNEKVTFYKSTGELKHETTSNQIETAWMSKELVFRSQKLENVFNTLSRKFAVRFKINKKDILNDIYTGTFEDKDIEDIMKVLKLHYNFKYEITDNTISVE